MDCAPARAALRVSCTTCIATPSWISGSGAFGAGTGGGPFGGGSLVELNLNRWTIFFAVIFVVNVIVLLKIA